jgi:hypothetical protein
MFFNTDERHLDTHTAQEKRAEKKTRIQKKERKKKTPTGNRTKSDKVDEG